MEENKLEKKNLKKYRKLLLLTILCVIAVYFGLFMFYKAWINPNEDAYKTVEEYLYTKYSYNKIKNISLYSVGIKKDLNIICGNFSEFPTKQYVFKYYSDDYPNDEFFVTLWIDSKNEKTEIKEINGNEVNCGDDSDCGENRI